MSLVIPLLSVIVTHFLSTDGQLTYRTDKITKLRNVPDIFKKAPDFIEKSGYNAEIHDVITEDQYILQLHRILSKSNDSKNKSVVLIMHGLQSSSDNWLLLGNRSLPYLLTKENYDVWLGNTRGNTYGLRHKTLKSTDLKFWEFSFHEQGYFDLAAIIDYILNATDKPNLFYIGHSKGTTISYVLLSLRPEYNKKIKVLVHLAPVAYVGNTNSPLLQLAFNVIDPQLFETILHGLNFYGLPELSNLRRTLGSFLCNERSIIEPFCWGLHFLTSGFDYESINSNITELAFSHFPDGGSIREMLHYLQVARSGKFRRYNFGRANKRIYNSSKPPEYPLENIEAPVVFFYAYNDYYVTLRDFQKLLNRLKNVFKVHYITLNRFNHIDYVLANNAEKYVYQPAIKIMRKFL